LKVKTIQNAKINLFGGKYFSYSEYRTIRRKVSANGALVESLHQVLKRGIKLDSALKTALSNVNKTVRQYESECKSQTIKDMCKNGKTIASSHNVEQVSNLINDGLITDSKFVLISESINLI